jgi:hypothetical protein
MLSLLWPVVIVDGVSFGKHALVEDARNQNSAGLLAIKHNMPAALHSAQAGTNFLAASTKGGIVRQLPATCFKIIDVTDRLSFAPRSKGISANTQKVRFGTTRKAKRCHGLARL